MTKYEWAEVRAIVAKSQYEAATRVSYWLGGIIVIGLLLTRPNWWWAYMLATVAVPLFFLHPFEKAAKKARAAADDLYDWTADSNG